MNRPSPAQMAYIDSLYEKLNVSYSKRIRASNTLHASALIRELQSRVDERVEKAMREEIESF